MNVHRNDLPDIAARAKRRYPDHRMDGGPFQVCLPVYELRLKVTEVTETELPTPARFVLQLANLDVAQPDQLAKLLGLSDTLVASAAAELLGGDLVAQGPDRSIQLTERGKQVLAAGGKMWRPRNGHIKVPYDPLTKQIIDIDPVQLLDRDVVRKNGLFVVPTKPQKPRLSSIHINEVKDYMAVYRGGHRHIEVLEVSDIKDAKLRYRNDTVIVKMDAPNSGMPTFAVYRAQQYLEEESVLVQRLADRGVELVPAELRAVPNTPWLNSIITSKEETVLLEDIEELDNRVAEAEWAVEEAKATQGVTQNSQERLELAARIEQLEADKTHLQGEIAERESRLNTLTQGQTRIIKTEEHRPLLLRAAASATSELTLVSAWIDPFAFDDELCRALVDAIGRGAVVRIAWGFGVNKPGPDATRNREKGNTALTRLRNLIPRNLRARLVTKITETHEKFIICDDLFCAVGSFNWLSYRGQRDSGYRREASLYSENQEIIDLWKDNARTLFQ